MKKVSVQFNLVVDDDTLLNSQIQTEIEDLFKNIFEWKITNIQINNTEKRGKR